MSLSQVENEADLFKYRLGRKAADISLDRIEVTAQHHLEHIGFKNTVTVCT